MKKKQYSSLNDMYNEFYKNLNILRTICINTFGISTLVINNNDLYKQYYEKNNSIQSFFTMAYTNHDYLVIAKDHKKIILDILEQELKDIEKNINFVPFIYYNNYDSKRNQELTSTLNNYFNHFQKSRTVDGKKKVKKVISKILDLKIEEEKKYVYRYCNNSDEI